MSRVAAFRTEAEAAVLPCGSADPPFAVPPQVRWRALAQHGVRWYRGCSKTIPAH